jgi:N-hydroxyarylamine O-acetyltransferase
VFDLPAYLSRLGLAGEPSLAELHRAHVVAIPFENLDPRRGVAPSLELDALQAKLVARRRGGYCFEHNLLLRGALEATGRRAEPMLSRVRWGVAPGVVRPRTHLVLRVTEGEETWLADAGFGAGTLLEPVPFGPGGPYEQSGWRFRVVEEGDALVVQAETPDGWRDVHAFVPEPVPLIDIELSNWFTATHPSSAFVTGLIVAVQQADGTRVSLSDWSGDLALVERTPDHATTTPVTREDVPVLLDQRFGLPGFALDGAGRVAATA